MKSPLIKIIQSDCVFPRMIGKEENYSLSLLGDFNWSFEGLIEPLFKICHWNMIFKGNQSSPWNAKFYQCYAGKTVKTGWMQGPLPNLNVNKSGYHGASCQLSPANSQAIWTHKVQYFPTAVYYQQVLLMRNEDGMPSKTCWIQFYPIHIC